MTRSRRTIRFWIVPAACLLAGAGGLPVATLALEPVVHEVTIGGFRLRTELATSRRTERSEGEFRYRAELVNETGADAAGVVAEVSSSLAATSIRDDLLIFGDVPRPSGSGPRAGPFRRRLAGPEGDVRPEIASRVHRAGDLGSAARLNPPPTVLPG